MSIMGSGSVVCGGNAGVCGAGGVIGHGDVPAAALVSIVKKALDKRRSEVEYRTEERKQGAQMKSEALIKLHSIVLDPCMLGTGYLVIA